MTLYGAGANADEAGSLRDGSAGGHVRRQHVHLALRRLGRERAAQVPVPHASRLAAASHSSRPSIGIS